MTLDPDRPMYRWREMTPERREQALSYRRTNRLPWHSPPHYEADTSYYFTLLCSSPCSLQSVGSYFRTNHHVPPTHPPARWLKRTRWSPASRRFRHQSSLHPHTDCTATQRLRPPSETRDMLFAQRPNTESDSEQPLGCARTFFSRCQKYAGLVTPDLRCAEGCITPGKPLSTCPRTSQILSVESANLPSQCFVAIPSGIRSPNTPRSGG